MTDRELMRKALENLEDVFGENRKDVEIVKELRDRLAQTEPGPVAWSYWQSCLNDDGTQTAPWVHRLSKFKPSESIINKEVVPLYTTPPQRKPLTDKEILDAFCVSPGLHQFVQAFKAGVCFAEAAHGIKL